MRFSVGKDDPENILYLMERFEKCAYIEELDGDNMRELIDLLGIQKEKVGKGYRQEMASTTTLLAS